MISRCDVIDGYASVFFIHYDIFAFVKFETCEIVSSLSTHQIANSDCCTEPLLTAVSLSFRTL